MKHIRYYAIGHSYLLHGPFDGWQTDGFWGMAATAPENDYFHKFSAYIENGFNAKVEAVAENHADFERCCTLEATRESLISSAGYAHMEEVIKNFKPNVITVFLGENTISKDEASQKLFYEVLYEMINKHKRSETVVICACGSGNVNILNPIAEKYGFVVCNCSIVHFKDGEKYPYYAFEDYPEYNEKAKMGAVEFRTHPGNKGHEKIASVLFENAKDMLAKIPDGKFLEEYTFEKYVKKQKIEKFNIKTNPQMFLQFGGFNVRQIGDNVRFSSAPGTGASVSAYPLCISKEYNKFCIEMAVADAKGEQLKLYVFSRAGKQEFSKKIKNCEMTEYEFDISEIDETITRFVVAPEMSECTVTVKSVKFLK